jgi:hypothetical protein
MFDFGVFMTSKYKDVHSFNKKEVPKTLIIVTIDYFISFSSAVSVEDKYHPESSKKECFDRFDSHHLAETVIFRLKNCLKFRLNRSTAIENYNNLSQ